MGACTFDAFQRDLVRMRSVAVVVGAASSRWLAKGHRAIGDSQGWQGYLCSVGDRFLITSEVLLFSDLFLRWLRVFLFQGM